MKKIISNLHLQSNLLVIAFVVALGSNADAKNAFSVAVDELSNLGKLQLSSIMVGCDFTGRTTAMYHNACALVELNESTAFQTVYENLKNIEKRCGRRPKDSIVPMDLDILAVFDGDAWHISQKKLPFHAHEKAGLAEVAEFLLELD